MQIAYNFNIYISDNITFVLSHLGVFETPLLQYHKISSFAHKRGLAEKMSALNSQHFLRCTLGSATKTLLLGERGPWMLHFFFNKEHRVTKPSENIAAGSTGGGYTRKKREFILYFTETRK